MTTFNDIEIIGIDDEKSLSKLNVNGGRIRVHYELSDTPPRQWQRIFAKTHGRSNLYRQFRATVSGKYVILEMGTDEVRQHIAPEYRTLLDNDVANTNRQYRQHLEKLAHNAAAKKATEQREQETARQMLQNMKSKDSNLGKTS